jgi:hypothetical protein
MVVESDEGMYGSTVGLSSRLASALDARERRHTNTPDRASLTAVTARAISVRTRRR